MAFLTVDIHYLPAWSADAWEEGKHPRGQPGNAGEFAKGSGGGGAAKAAPAKRIAAPKTKTSPASRSETSAKLTPAPLDRAKWPAHIQQLKVPPAWTDVHYSDDPEAPLQVRGKDEKGRRQPIYLASYLKSNSAVKFARIKELDAKFAKVQSQNAKNQQSQNASVRNAADCMSVVMEMGIRPGSDVDTMAKVKAYGATTLEGKHVVQTPEGVRLRFTGKKGVPLDLPVTNPSTAKLLLQRAKHAGPDGNLFGVTSKQLLTYSHTLDGGGFKTKDFRTLLGTRIAMQEIAKAKAPPTDAKSYKVATMAVAKQVSQKLGNTPAVALVSYISPLVFSSWKEHANVA